MEEPKFEMTRIGEAIVKVSAGLKRLEKLHENQHGNYKFASVDDFKDMIRPLEAAAGIFTVVSEESFELIALKNSKDKDTNVAKIRFKFTVHHCSGENMEPFFLTVCLPYTGAQTSGAAQSYAIKEGLFKGLYRASSGDVSEEADLHDQNQYGAGDRLSKAEARPVYEALTKEMRAVVAEERDYTKLADWWSANREQLNMLPVDWHLQIKEQYAREYKVLKATENLDKMAGTEP